MTLDSSSSSLSCKLSESEDGLSGGIEVLGCLLDVFFAALFRCSFQHSFVFFFLFLFSFPFSFFFSLCLCLFLFSSFSSNNERDCALVKTLAVNFVPLVFGARLCQFKNFVSSVTNTLVSVKLTDKKPVVVSESVVVSELPCSSIKLLSSCETSSAEVLSASSISSVAALK